jgi:3-mercaptopyruvate sulfurtransferase SseA
LISVDKDYLWIKFRPRKIICAKYGVIYHIPVKLPMEAKKTMFLKRLFRRVKSMKSQEAKTFMENQREGTYTLLDVRQPKEYKEAHIPGAKLIPLAELGDSLTELDSARPVIVY